MQNIVEKIYDKILPKADYMIICPKAPDYGFFAHFLNICGDLNAAIRGGFKPYIDMKTYKSIFITKQEVGEINAWEQYFLQPFPELEDNLKNFQNAKFKMRIKKNYYVLKKRKEGRKIIQIMDFPTAFVRPNDSMEFLTNESEISYWRNLVRTYVKVNQDTLKHITYLKKDIKFTSEDKVLGVLVRGTDFINKKPYNHPIPPTPEEALDKVYTVMKAYKCNKVYLATEDQGVFNYFQENLGKSLIFVPQKRYVNTGTTCLNDVYEKENVDLHQLGLDYIATILLLSECDCLVAARTSGAVAALLLSPGYQYVYFWNKGRYSKNEYMLK